MAKFLTNKETQAALEKVISKAEKQLILISPYIKLPNTLLARIKLAAEKDVKVKIVYRETGITTFELERLHAIKNVTLKKTSDLHAKCYFNEKEMIITSLNLLDSSEKNWEMGVLISRKDDKEMYEDAMQEAKTIYEDSIQLPETRKNLKAKVKEEITVSSIPELNSKKLPSKGNCIRCEKKIVYDPEKPYCFDCWNKWIVYNNPTFAEKICHECGKYWPATMNEPICNDCRRPIAINDNIDVIIEELSKSIDSVFPGNEAKVSENLVTYKSFMEKPVTLELITGRDHFRIVFKLEHSPYSAREKLYKVLSKDRRLEIEGLFPKKSVNWGSQMKRIKIDLNKKDNPEFFGPRDVTVRNLLDLLKIGALKIVRTL